MKSEISDLEVAPNTPGVEITLSGSYHAVSTTRYGLGASTVSDGDYKARNCRKCRTVAKPAHCVGQPSGAIAVYCEVHCPTCIRHRKSL